MITDLQYNLRLFDLYIILQSVDVWSCGVALYVMLVGAYPFEDPKDPRNFRKTVQVFFLMYKIK